MAGESESNSNDAQKSNIGSTHLDLFARTVNNQSHPFGHRSVVELICTGRHAEAGIFDTNVSIGHDGDNGRGAAFVRHGVCGERTNMGLTATGPCVC